MRYLVDTDWIIDALVPVPPALDLLDSLSRGGLAVSIITLAELFEGAYRSPNPADGLRAIRAFLSGYGILNLSEAIIEVFARTRADLRRQGQSLADLDLLIAATALTYDLILVTRNRRHFGRVPGLRLYQPNQRSGSSTAPGR